MARKWWLAAIVTMATGAAACYAVASCQADGPGVTKANFDRIEDGMSELDVEAIFGKKAENVYQCYDSVGTGLGVWRTSNGSAVAAITFQLKTVRDKRWREETISEKFRRWVGLREK